MDLAIVLGGIGVALYSTSFLVSFTMLILICVRIRPLKSNVSMLLICNTYLNAGLVSSIMLMMYTYNLLGNIHAAASFDGRWCEIRAFFTLVCFCSLYYSFVLQAVFRLFRIVFYRHKALQSVGVGIIAVTLQWVLAFLSILANILLHDFQYLPTEFNCWIAFQNIRGLIMVTIMIFNNPLTIIFNIYMQIIRYTRRTAQMQQRRQNANKRDLAVLKRIVILVFVIVGMGLPTVVVVLIYIITQSVIPYAYHIQGLCIALGVLTASICLVFVTPQIQQIFTKSRTRIRPHETVMVYVNQLNAIDQTQVN